MNANSTEQLELVYFNGAAVTSEQVAIPHFTDVSLSRIDTEKFDDLVKDSKKYLQTIRSDREALEVADYLAQLRREDKRLADRIFKDKGPWQLVIDQILTACNPWRKKFKDIEEEGKNYIANWQAQKKAGQLAAETRSRQKAEAKRAEAQYADNPKKQHQATLAAKAYEKDARQMSKSPVLPGIDTEEYLKEVVVLDRRKAAAMDEEAVEVTPFHPWFVKDIAEKKKAGVKVWTHMYPGIELVFATRVRLPRA